MPGPTLNLDDGEYFIRLHHTNGRAVRALLKRLGHKGFSAITDFGNGDVEVVVPDNAAGVAVRLWLRGLGNI